jgi:hypothetical protein
MCDYSLMAVPNRLARQGEELIVHRFPTGTIGLASPTDLNPKPRPAQAKPFWTIVKEFFDPQESQSVPAVCIPPGANLILHDIPVKLRKELDVGRDEDVTFTQTSAAPNTHRDAVRFKGGREVRLQELREGQRVEVVDLSMAEDRVPNLAEFAELPVGRSLSRPDW